MYQPAHIEHLDQLCETIMPYVCVSRGTDRGDESIEVFAPEPRMPVEEGDGCIVPGAAGPKADTKVLAIRFQQYLTSQSSSNMWKVVQLRDC